MKRTLALGYVAARERRPLRRFFLDRVPQLANQESETDRRPVRGIHASGEMPNREKMRGQRGGQSTIGRALKSSPKVSAPAALTIAVSIKAAE